MSFLSRNKCAATAKRLEPSPFIADEKSRTKIIRTYYPDATENNSKTITRLSEVFSI